MFITIVNHLNTVIIKRIILIKHYKLQLIQWNLVNADVYTNNKNITDINASLIDEYLNNDEF